MDMTLTNITYPSFFSFSGLFIQISIFGGEKRLDPAS